MAAMGIQRGLWRGGTFIWASPVTFGKLSHSAPSPSPLLFPGLSYKWGNCGGGVLSS